MIIIETERLILRAFRESDLADFYEYASAEGVGEMAGWSRHKTVEESRSVLQRFIAGNEVFAIALKNTGKVIGSIGIHDRTRYAWFSGGEYASLNTKEIGYALSKDYWGQGIMTEACRAVIGYAFGGLGLDALFIAHFVENARSQRVIEKCGFNYIRNADFFAEQLQKTFNERIYILYKR